MPSRHIFDCRYFQSSCPHGLLPTCTTSNKTATTLTIVAATTTPTPSKFIHKRKIDFLTSRLTWVGRPSTTEAATQTPTTTLTLKQFFKPKQEWMCLSFCAWERERERARERERDVACVPFQRSFLYQNLSQNWQHLNCQWMIVVDVVFQFLF